LGTRRGRRRGLSYLEVLIAAGIALTGILGAVALYPVAIMNLQKGQVIDVMASAGPSALHSGEALGVTRTSSWLAYDPAGRQWTRTGFITTTPSPPTNLPARPGMWHSFCFDPRFAAEGSPATPTAAFEPSLFPFKPSGNVDDVRMARLTLRRNPDSGTDFNPLGIAQSRLLFKVENDLIFERPTDKVAPALQLPIQRDDGNVVRRNYMGDYEFVITMTPSLRGIPVGFGPNPALNPISYVLGGGNVPNEPMPMDRPTEYLMSAVVFYKRQVALNSYLSPDRNEPEAERVSDVFTFWNSGFNGGDLTIQSRTAIASSLGNELEVHSGDWVLLSGNMYCAPPAQRKFMGPHFQWYRVASVNGDSYDGGGGFHRRDLTLDGPDWPVTLVPNTQLSIISGVVGVFSAPVQVK
jgi:hypothetical protein